MALNLICSASLNVAASGIGVRADRRSTEKLIANKPMTNIVNGAAHRMAVCQLIRGLSKTNSP